MSVTGRFLVFLGCILVGFLFSMSAAPDADGAEAIPTFPMIQKSTDLGIHTVIVEGPDRLGGLRTVVEHVDRQLPYVEVWSRPGFVCNPNVTCIRVTVRDYGPFPPETCGGLRSWAGCALVGGIDPWIKLNRHWPLQQSLSCHEALHALGLDHHSGAGCLGTGGDLPSPAEIATLRGLYP